MHIDLCLQYMMYFLYDVIFSPQQSSIWELLSFGAFLYVINLLN